MIREILSAIQGNVTQRLRNPFLGTLSLVFIVKNWAFIYQLFIFDRSESTQTRMSRLQVLYDQTFSWENLFICFGLAIVLFLGTMLLLVFSQFVTQFVEKKIVPHVKRATDSKVIVVKERFDDISAKLKEKEDKLEEERKKLTDLREENAALQEKILSLTVADKKSPNSRVEPTKVEKTGPSTNAADTQMFQRFLSESTIQSSIERINSLVSEIRRKDEVDIEDRVLNIMIKYNFVELARDSTRVGSTRTFEFTELGNRFVQFYVMSR